VVQRGISGQAAPGSGRFGDHLEIMNATGDVGPSLCGDGDGVDAVEAAVTVRG
jgi:hypothetical protein